MKRLIISTCILMAVFLHSDAYSAFKVYLKNGRIISGVDAVERNDKIKIYKGKIILELPRSDIIKMEEYEIEIPEEKPVEEKIQVMEEKMPEYLRHKKIPYEKEKEKERHRREKLLHLRGQLQLITDKVERIETLENKSKELERGIRKKWLPGKARKSREEKAEIDKELESLRMKKDTLLRRKRNLEYRIDTLEKQ